MCLRTSYEIGKPIMNISSPYKSRNSTSICYYKKTEFDSSKWLSRIWTRLRQFQNLGFFLGTQFLRWTAERVGLVDGGGGGIRQFVLQDNISFKYTSIYCIRVWVPEHMYTKKYCPPPIPVVTRNLSHVTPSTGLSHQTCAKTSQSDNNGSTSRQYAVICTHSRFAGAHGPITNVRFHTRTHTYHTRMYGRVVGELKSVRLREEMTDGRYEKKKPIF